MTEENVTRLACPKCGSEDVIQLEEAAIYVNTIIPAKDGEPPRIDYSSGETHWSDCGVTRIVRSGGTHQLVCYAGEDGCGHAWDPPTWVLEALERNSNA